MSPDPASPLDLVGPPSTSSGRVHAPGRAESSLITVLAVLLVAGLACACGSSAAAAGHAMSTEHPGTSAPARPSTPNEAETAAAEGATTAFRADIENAASSFVTDVEGLQAAIDSGGVVQARSDELAAQADYDRFRLLEGDDQTTAATLDELESEVGAHQSFGGLHAVERDLWASGDAPEDISGLVAQAPVAQYLLDKEVLGPEAIGTTGVGELSWVDDVAIPGREELYSRRDAVDIAATVGAADDAFTAIRPLGELVDPSLTSSVGRQFTQLSAMVVTLGHPTQLLDQDIATGTRLALSQHVDATAAELSKLAAALAPFGTTGPSS